MVGIQPTLHECSSRAHYRTDVSLLKYESSRFFHGFINPQEIPYLFILNSGLQIGKIMVAFLGRAGSV